jgi:transposase
MTSLSSTTVPVWVAIDVAKAFHQVLIEVPGGQRRAMRVANSTTEVDRLVTYLRSLTRSCTIAFEPTGDYHRPVMHALGRAGFHLCQVSSLAVARTRDAQFNSWDKNDPKDAQVILHLLKTGATQRFLDPLVTGHHDLQELANTYQQVSLRKVRLQHAIVTHHLPLYFPEAERYLHRSRAEWFTDLLLLTPCPMAVRRYSKAAFIAAVRERVGGRKVDKARWLADFYVHEHQPRRPALAQAIRRLGPLRQRAARTRLHSFCRTISWRMWRSSVRSATTCFSFAFSCRSDRSSRSSCRPSPVNCFFQR